MPCYTYTDDPQQKDESSLNGESQQSNDNKPQPPVRYTPNPTPNSEPPQFQHPLQDEASKNPEFRKVRNFVTASQIVALVSLIFGGVILSTVAIILGFIARSKATTQMNLPQNKESESWYILRRSATIATIMSFVALGLNFMALMTIYPLVIETLQNGDASSIFGGSPSTPSKSSSVW